MFCPNSSVKFWLRLFVPCFSHFFARCVASNSKIASPDPKIHYPKFNQLLVQNTKPLQILQQCMGRLCCRTTRSQTQCSAGAAASPPPDCEKSLFAAQRFTGHRITAGGAGEKENDYFCAVAGRCVLRRPPYVMLWSICRLS